MNYRDNIQIVTSTSTESKILACNYSNALDVFKGTSIVISRHYKTVEFKNFLRLKNRWLDDVKFSSNSNVIYNNDAYKKIIGLGKKSIPWIIRDLKRTNAHWFNALSQISGENPIQSEHAGIVKKMAEDWILWAENKGYDR